MNAKYNFLEKENERLREELTDLKFKILDAVLLFEKCQQAKDIQKLTYRYAEFNEYFNKAFIGVENDKENNWEK